MKINVLTPKIYNRIAAGEVVENQQALLRNLWKTAWTRAQLKSRWKYMTAE